MDSKHALKKLQKLVDEVTYKKILNSLAGATVYFPSNSEWTDRDDRNQRMKEDYYSGMFEIRELAQKYDLSISRVYKIIQSR